MSANNQLVIIKRKGFFEVHENFCVDNDFELSDDYMKKFKTLEEAISYANEYCREEVVEYGTYICDSCLK